MSMLCLQLLQRKTKRGYSYSWKKAMKAGISSDEIINHFWVVKFRL